MPNMISDTMHADALSGVRSLAIEIQNIEGLSLVGQVCQPCSILQGACESPSKLSRSAPSVVHLPGEPRIRDRSAGAQTYTAQGRVAPEYAARPVRSAQMPFSST